MENLINIVWAAPGGLSRDGIIALLNQEPDFNFLKIISAREEVMATLGTLPETDLLIIDHIFLSDQQSFLLSLKEIAPQMRVLVLSGIEYDEDVLSLIKSGADGYIVNEANKDELVFAIKHILSGNTYICTALYLKVLESIAHLGMGETGEPLAFSEREEQILKLILEGYSNQEIAYQLFTNKRTILKYRENLLQKTGAPNIGTVIRMALQQGILN